MAVEVGTWEDIDTSDVTGDNGDVNLLQWLCSTEKILQNTPVDYLKTKQSDIEATLTKIILATDPFPVPGRVLRNVISRCFISIYTRLEAKTLFDTLQSLIKVVSDFKTADRDSHKSAAFSCIGDLMAVFGSQCMSLMAEICTVALKTAKSSNSQLLRFHALNGLSNSLKGARRAVSDSTAKDIFKQMRNYLTDKTLPVQRGACQVLINMYSGSDAAHPSLSDIEAILTLCVKSLENADQITRSSLAQLAGHLLASTQIPRVVPIPEPTSKKEKEKKAEEEEDGPGIPQTETSKPLLSPSEMLFRLSVHFNKPNASRKARIGVFGFYVALLQTLGSGFAENNYAVIVGHFFFEIASVPRNLSSSRHDQLLVRTLVGIILREVIGVRMLSEQGQIGAIQELSNSYLKRWPAMMPGQTAPNSLVLAIALREIAGLVQQLGNAPPPAQDAVADSLITLLAHPSHTVRVAASWTLRCFCYSTPLRLPKTIMTVMEMLQRDLNTILSPAAPSDINLRTLGHAYGLSGLVCVIAERPLYVSYDVSAKVLDMAIQLLKRAGEHDVKVAGVEVEVAWTLIAALMSLGPNFVRPHVSQLLVLWRNALPKPTTKENSMGRSFAEWMFLLHVRESALGAILSFLRHNNNAGANLVTLDVGRRISSVLGNALQFANAVDTGSNNGDSETQQAQQQTKGLTIQDREALLRRRIYQCFTILGFSSLPDTTQGALLQSTIKLFGSSEGYAGSSVQAAIASSSGTFTSVWQTFDGYAYGTTYLEVEAKDGDLIEGSFETLLNKPILGAWEHDPLAICCHIPTYENLPKPPPPPTTSVVDAAIELFSQLLPLQDVNATSRALSELLEVVKSPKLDKNVGRKAAVTMNAAVALVLALRATTAGGGKSGKDTLGSVQVSTSLASFLKEILIGNDRLLRLCASEALGRLASLAGTNFLTSQIKSLVDQVVNNRDPYARAGCALAFGSIYIQVGGLAAGPLLKTTVNVLMSLGNDPHPVVHYHALRALSNVIDAASLGYGPFVSGTLGMLLKIYLMESHEREGGSVVNANLSGEYPAYPISCRIIDDIIRVLGPDVQESRSRRELILNLVNEFMQEEEEVGVEAIKCIQHFLMFAPGDIDTGTVVTQFRKYLGPSTKERGLKVASINALYQLVQRDGLEMSKVGGDQLVEELFSMLDEQVEGTGGAEGQGVRSVIESWLEQTVVYNPSAWIDLCQRIMSKTTTTQQVASGDDEGQGILQAQDSTTGGLTARWRTQLFALQCLHRICVIVGADSARGEHLSPAVARVKGLSTHGLLYTRVPDLIKMAFTASAAYVTDIRLEGLVVLRDVIQVFSKTPDPSFEQEALLLEQHQAPITAALTPAFSSDSTTPEILASAVTACATFVGCGVIKDVKRMGRILKLLTNALSQLSSSSESLITIGETGTLSPNGSAMLRISILTAWAELRVSEASYLDSIVEPHKGVLAKLWIGLLRDYASVRVGDDDSTSDATAYGNLGKEVLLPYYEESWVTILRAVASSMQANDREMVAAMDGLDMPPTIPMSKRKEPTMFFYILFGLVFEALSSSASSSTAAALETLKCLVRPEYSGNAIRGGGVVYEEFISMCYRIGMTENASLVGKLIEVMHGFALGDDEGSGDVSATSARGHCIRVCSYVIRHAYSTSPIIQGEMKDRVKMITNAFSALTSIASGLVMEREDVRAVAALLYSEMLKDESNEIDMISPTLPCLKAILTIPVATEGRGMRDRYEKLVHGILSACLLNVDEMRGRTGNISTKKMKSNLLACVLVFTTSTSTRLSMETVERCCEMLTRKLLDFDEVSLTAAQCIRTLLTSPTSSASICSKLLMPSLIEFVVRGKGGKENESLNEEVWKALIGFFNGVSDESHRARLLAILIPISLNTGGVKQLLMYASVAPGAFKEVAGKLDGNMKEALENEIRKAVGGASSAAPSTSTGKPAISLRSF